MRILAHQTGPAGEGWKTEYSPEESKNPADATLSHWIIHAPKQSPAWEYYVIFGVHLRPIPGTPPPVQRHPSATHDIMILALNPKMGDDVRPENYLERINQVRSQGEGWYLTPINFTGQFEGTDDECVRLTDQLARMIIAARLPAEPPMSGGDYWTTYLQYALQEMRSPVRVSEEGSIGGGRSAMDWPDCGHCGKVKVPTNMLPAFPTPGFLASICRCE